MPRPAADFTLNKDEHMTLALVVEFRIKPAHIEAFAAAMHRNATSSRDTEPGCRQFDVCRDDAEPGLFYLYELYDDAKAIEAHIASAHYREFDALTLPWVADKKVRRLRRTSPPAA
jgi:autoinducer 2-degrading protein